MTVAQDIHKLAIDSGAVELYILDGLAIGMPVLLYFTPNTAAGLNVSFQGQVYQPLPVQMEGIQKATDGQPPRPVLKVSNVTKYLQSYLTSYSDLVGARVTRKVTLRKYLDDGATPGNQLLSDETFVIDQKKQSRRLVEFTLTSPLDVSGQFIPARAVRRSEFPGAGRTRTR